MPEEASRLEMGLKSILLSGDNTDKEDEISPSAALCPRSLRTRGPAVIGVEDVSRVEEETREVQ